MRTVVLPELRKERGMFRERFQIAHRSFPRLMKSFPLSIFGRLGAKMEPGIILVTHRDPGVEHLPQLGHDRPNQHQRGGQMQPWFSDHAF